MTVENSDAYFSWDVCETVLKINEFRKKLIRIGESGGEIELSKKDSALLASMLRDWRDEEII